MKESPSAATQPGYRGFGDYGGSQQTGGDGITAGGGGINTGGGTGILQSESVPMMGQTSFRRPSFPPFPQPPYWTGVFSMVR